MRKMRLKHAKCVLAAVLACSMLPLSGAVVSAAVPETIFSTDFESGDTQDWYVSGTAKLDVVTTENATEGGSHSLMVSGREATWAGPEISLSGKVEMGATYQLSGKVKYTSDIGPAQETFNVNIRKISGQQTFATSGPVTKGEWGTFSGDIVISEEINPDQVSIYVDTAYYQNPTPEQRIDYYLDDMKLVKTKDAPTDDPENPEDKTTLAKEIGNSNPLVDYKFGADPFAMVYDGRVYIYMTNDSQQFAANNNGSSDNGYGAINTINVISSADMVNWTDHGSIAVAGPNGAAKWANNSWAPAAAHKTIDGKEKFFLYFADNGSGIGVLEADSPIGPFRDPIGKQLIARNTQASDGVVWLFDPAVLVDDDGTGYLYYGGGIDGKDANNPMTGRVIKLADDMIHTEGDAQVIDAPALFEDSGIHKYGGKYYYSYCSNFAEHKEGYPGQGNICYMVSDDPMGPFTYVGEILGNPATFFGVGGNNHHAIFEFKDKYYITYHAQTVGKALGNTRGYRSTHIDEVTINEDGTIQPITGTYKGISQLESLNPYQRIEAETIAWKSGAKTAAKWVAGLGTDACAEPGSMVDSLNRALVNAQNGDWTALAGVDFGKNGAASLEVYASSVNGAEVDVRLDSPAGEVVGTAVIETGGENAAYKSFSADLNGVSGKHNVFFTFRGEGKDILHVDYWKFTEKEEEKPPVEKEDVSDLFGDVGHEEWYEPAVQFVYDNKIMTGLKDKDGNSTGEFGTEMDMNRAFFVQTLYNIADMPPVAVPDEDHIFPDIPNTSELFYRDAVIWSKENEVITGYTEGPYAGMFGPTDGINREQMVTMLYRYVTNVLGEKPEISDAKFNTFADRDSVSEFALNAMKWATEKGIIEGENHTDVMNPQGVVNRAVCSQIIMNFYEATAK